MPLRGDHRLGRVSLRGQRGASVAGTAPQALVTLAVRYVRHAPGTLGKSALTTHWLNARLRERPRRRVVRVRSGGLFAVDTRDLIQRYLYLFGAWEPHLTAWLRRRLRRGTASWTSGRTSGSSACSRLNSSARRATWSPSRPPPTCTAVWWGTRGSTASTTSARSTPPCPTAARTLHFVLASSRNTGANSIVPYDGPAESGFEAEARPLPELLDPAELAGARVIKIDVEGAEGGVVRGLAPVLGDLRPDAEICVEVTPERMALLGDSVDDLLGVMRDAGFHVYRLANDYAPGSYPAALRGEPGVPVRWRGPVVEGSDLVFSRVDAETLP